MQLLLGSGSYDEYVCFFLYFVMVMFVRKENALVGQISATEIK